MERHQYQNWSADSEPPLSNQPESSQSDQKEVGDSRVETAAQLVQAHPILFLGGLWVSIFLVGSVALSGLLSPGLPAGRRASEAAFGSSTVATNVAQPKEQSHSRIPIWLFGAITLSCTAGSIFVSKQLTRTERNYKIARPKQSRKYGAVVDRPVAVADRPPRPRKPAPVRRTSSRKAQPKRLKPFSPSDYPAPLPAQPSAQAYHPVSFPVATTQRSEVRTRHPQRVVPKNLVKQPVPQVPVTIVPPEENHPLDWGEASLADTLDLRKQRSLSSWM
ncbi:hypothetical protein K9N68_07580 [Kovacikia minuta CCNUW1]|uniref:hypothetical protein n=1 Tax=Kovacikia minuta TaxID=2931930 RepID=UPI001CCF324B|nr:hypothetical protein [Kovacikia minuta]UBF27765.1 hypothetical protein K9N68_07580 [Kovacikia minuta CCNUW1]